MIMPQINDSNPAIVPATIQRTVFDNPIDKTWFASSSMAIQNAVGRPAIKNKLIAIVTADMRSRSKRALVGPAFVTEMFVMQIPLQTVSRWRIGCPRRGSISNSPPVAFFTGRISAPTTRRTKEKHNPTCALATARLERQSTKRHASSGQTRLKLNFDLQYTY
ncbi:MAG: hypothetical protein ACR2PI_26775 [Hyphomicrobiaceae bacterium]